MSVVLDRVGTIADEILAPAADRTDREAAFPTHTFHALREAGLLGLVIGADAGGLGGSMMDAARVVERISRACGSSGMTVCMHFAGALVIDKFGDLATRRAIADGTHISTLAFSEAGSRSHFWAPVSSATADGDGVRIDAKKSWVTSAHHAHAYVWSSRPTQGDGASSIWLVPRTAPGISMPAAFDGLGLRGNDSTPVSAEGVSLTDAARLGPDGGGFDVMMGTVLPAFSLMNSACSIGLMEATIAAAATHIGATRHTHLDTRLADLPTIRAYLARMKIRADQARTLWEDTMTALATGRPDGMLRVLECKASAGEAALEVTSLGMRVCGGAAYRREVGVERAFRDAQASSVMAPTTDQLYDFIGKAVAGLPLF
jgi:alkylation response protein AidB-like acyl-CoA dehydrogenase